MPRRVMELTPGALAVRSLREARLENMGWSRVGALAAVSRTGASEEGNKRMEVTEAQELGHGGDACVYAVGTVVRKEFFQPQAFHRELEALRAVSHECIVTLVGVCWESMHLFFPRFDCDLCAALLSGCPVDHKKCFASLLGALAALHRQNIVHRDVKPENLLVMLETPSYVLCDFARSLALPAGRDIELPFSGTKAYGAPEALQGVCGCPADNFAAGCVIFAVVEQGLPFFDEELAGEDEVEAPPLTEAVEPACREVLKGLLRWKPQARLTAEAALAMLRAA